MGGGPGSFFRVSCYTLLEKNESLLIKLNI